MVPALRAALACHRLFVDHASGLSDAEAIVGNGDYYAVARSPTSSAGDYLDKTFAVEQLPVRMRRASGERRDTETAPGRAQELSAPLVAGLGSGMRE
ncbi:hypothetical protein D4Q52_06775 [Rhodopseudomonas palustris]|uniref:Uncharacterized protein n=2 Tax=Rhodopseudomonas palustris TaxID=1076 RepID=A0A418VJL6_RHOPL|nr:hypothetical protein D4Q52_06775 [Rhodopseudomonas palustris]